jgi:hypothetical protein
MAGQAAADTMSFELRNDSGESILTLYYSYGDGWVHYQDGRFDPGDTMYVEIENFLKGYKIVSLKGELESGGTMTWPEIDRSEGDVIVLMPNGKYGFE